MRRFFPVLVLLFAMGIADAAEPPSKRGPRTMRMEATAFALDGKATASGTVPHAGIVAADPRVLPMGTRVRITGSRGYDGVYTVTDSGVHMVGWRIDIFVTTRAKAKRFGRRMVTVEVLDWGTGKEDAQRKSVPAKAQR